IKRVEGGPTVRDICVRIPQRSKSTIAVSQYRLVFPRINPPKTKNIPVTKPILIKLFPSKEPNAGQTVDDCINTEPSLMSADRVALGKICIRIIQAPQRINENHMPRTILRPMGLLNTCLRRR